MSAPTFAEPDQGPLAGGRKVNARHDLTLGLWRRDCEISRGFPEMVIALRRSPGAWVRTYQRHCRSREVPPQGSLDPDPLQEGQRWRPRRISATPRPIAEAPTPTSAFEGSTARAAMFPVRGSRKSHPRIEDEPVGSDPAPSQGGNPRLEEPHNLVERVFRVEGDRCGWRCHPLR